MAVEIKGIGDVPVVVDVDDRVAVVTLDRPERRNALNRELLEGLPAVLARLDADESVDVIVLTGADPAFCAGLDLADVGSGRLALGRLPDHRGILPPVTKPMIGAVNGPAATGGLEVALSCDFLVASDRARFADTHARVGVMPGGGLSVRLARWVGVARAKQMSLTGAFVDAPTALAWGLVNQVVPHHELLPTARRLAADVAAVAGPAATALLGLYDDQLDAADEAAWDLERAASTSWSADVSDIERRRRDIIATGSRRSPGRIEGR
jgi:enoyl-CoA hydratase